MLRYLYNNFTASYHVFTSPLSLAFTDATEIQAILRWTSMKAKHSCGLDSISSTSLKALANWKSTTQGFVMLYNYSTANYNTLTEEANKPLMYVQHWHQMMFEVYNVSEQFHFHWQYIQRTISSNACTHGPENYIRRSAYLSHVTQMDRSDNYKLLRAALQIYLQ